MAGNQVPNNIEDPTILKRFLIDLVSGLNTNPYYSGNALALQEAIVSALSNSTSNVDFLNTLSTLTELRTDILKYIEDNLETVILQNQEDVALIAEQYGAFYDKALAASWYGLSVKAGGAIAGLEVGSLDPDVTTPGDESSYFRVIADNFIVGRAYEDLSVEEKAYLADNGLPAFGTVYNEDKVPVPAIVTSWDNINKVYKHFFNGIVQFSNISGADYASAINNGTTTINGGLINTVGLIAENISATEINGLVINGGIINGARINGAVIKASYLDLDGELEVLTNYHISVATRNANPSLYTDAVYISADNEYRIPSLSTIKEANKTINTLGGILYGNIRSYNTANAGHNTKAVKVRPYITIAEDIIIYTTSNFGNGAEAGALKKCTVTFGSTSLLVAEASGQSVTINGSIYPISVGSTVVKTVTVNGFTFTVTASFLFVYSSNRAHLEVVLNKNTGFYPTSDFSYAPNGLKIQDSSVYTTGTINRNLKITSAISINNMI